MTVLFLIVFITILISANCSLHEAVLYSIRMGMLESAKTRKLPLKGLDSVIKYNKILTMI
jgi:hypothetical protein